MSRTIGYSPRVWSNSETGGGRAAVCASYPHINNNDRMEHGTDTTLRHIPWPMGEYGRLPGGYPIFHPLSLGRGSNSAHPPLTTVTLLGPESLSAPHTQPFLLPWAQGSLVRRWAHRVQYVVHTRYGMYTRGIPRVV